MSVGNPLSEWMKEVQTKTQTTWCFRIFRLTSLISVPAPETRVFQDCRSKDKILSILTCERQKKQECKGGCFSPVEPVAIFAWSWAVRLGKTRRRCHCDALNQELRSPPPIHHEREHEVTEKLFVKRSEEIWVNLSDVWMFPCHDFICHDLYIEVFLKNV